MLRIALSALIGSIIALGSCMDAMAYNPWPDEARGRALPRPKWTLVVPAHRERDGSLTIWDRRDEWTSAWLVPKTVDGLRMVTLRGDTEDARTITAQGIDDMEIAPLDRILRKYGAPSIALAVLDGDEVTVGVYVPGWRASWLPVDHAGSMLETRQAALDTIAFMTGDGRPADEVVDPRPASSLTIEAWRPSTNGYGTDILVVASEPSLMDTVARLPGVVSVTPVESDATGSRGEISYEGTPEDFEAQVASQGVSVR